MSMLTEIAAYLQTNSFGTKGTNLFIAKTPPQPPDLIWLAQGMGMPPVDTMGGTDHEQVPLYINLRFENYETGNTRAYAIFGLLHRFSGTLGSTRYVSIWGRFTPMFLGVDENNRYRWSETFDVRREL